MTCTLSVNKHQVVLGLTILFPTYSAKAWCAPCLLINIPGCFRADSVLPHRFNKGVTCALSVNKQARSLCGYGVGYVFPYTSDNGVTCILLVRGGHIVSWGRDKYKMNKDRRCWGCMERKQVRRRERERKWEKDRKETLLTCSKMATSWL